MGNEVRITYRWPDEAALYVTILADNAYPDALDQARATAIRTMTGAMRVIVEPADDDDTEDRDVV